ncbi:hypothetical protein MXD98_16420, partial [Legionella pneumophila]|nr:hypothetical protein [Legionella pneumophila]
VQKDYGANKIANELVNNKGCLLILNQKKYRYFIEDLNEFSCLVLNKDGWKLYWKERRGFNHQSASRYYGL